ncbi:MAG: sodium:calcium antiporter [Gammaproteobacteria bacterium]|nr:sodium:calcium antiporter [Gammaproteobacteria bacterium]MDH5651236.1 sodium:calcium antiporter [Gammaproteobacteria bacterium]
MLINLTQSLSTNILIFVIAALTIGVFGVRMTHVARKLAMNTDIGEALMGAVFIGAATSLSGIIASVTAASYGHAEMSVSNALGGIAAQTFFLAVADMFYRRANLEHAAASAENLMMGAFLICLLSVHAVAFAAPDYQIMAIHPASFLLLIGYILGIRILSKTHRMPMWLPRRTRETRMEKEPAYRLHKRKSNTPLWIRFIVFSFIVGVAGWALSKTGLVIAAETELSEGLVGGVFTAVSTSLPELVIAITAVRLRSLTLAVGDIIGGNAFDTLFIAVSDVAYRQGPIYAGISPVEQFWLAVTILMSGILLMGLLHREKHGIANIGWESFLVFLIYIGSLVYIAWT